MKKIVFLFFIALFSNSVFAFDKFSVEKITNDILTFDYKSIYYNFITSSKIAINHLYSKSQSISLNTKNSNEEQVFNSVLSECSRLDCSINNKFIGKGYSFIDTPIFEIDLFIPTENYNEFFNTIKQYGKIQEYNFTRNNNIQNIIDFYNLILDSKITLLNSLENSLTNKAEVFSFEKQTKMQEEKLSLNEQIFVLKKNINYLQSIQGKDHINIIIKKDFNSVYSAVKYSIQRTALFILKYIHIFMIVFFILFIKYFLIFILFLLKKLKRIFFLRKGRKKKSENTNTSYVSDINTSVDVVNIEPPEFKK